MAVKVRTSFFKSAYFYPAFVCISTLLILVFPLSFFPLSVPIFCAERRRKRIFASIGAKLPAAIFTAASGRLIGRTIFNLRLGKQVSNLLDIIISS